MIVPPPNPHKEAVLRCQDRELPCLFIHKPSNPYCPYCVRAKMRGSPHRPCMERPTRFGDVVAGDFLTVQEDHVWASAGGIML